MSLLRGPHRHTFTARHPSDLPLQQSFHALWRLPLLLCVAKEVVEAGIEAVTAPYAVLSWCECTTLLLARPPAGASGFTIASVLSSAAQVDRGQGTRRARRDLNPQHSVS
jgi:hypothetical protein